MFFTVLLLFFISCKKSNKEIVGVWNVDSKFYSATYKIHNKGDNLVAQALYYNDGTTLYKFPNKSNKKIYLFENLKKKKSVYIDAVAGETKTNMVNHAQLKATHKDTLEVTTYVMRYPLIEKWIRKENK